MNRIGQTLRIVLLGLGGLGLAPLMASAAGNPSATPPAAPPAQTRPAGAIQPAASPAQVRPRPAMTENQKIEYLIQHVGESGLTFIRNGQEYPAAKGASHLRRKWRWAGSRIKTARQFIQYLASGSSESGESYLVKFKDGKTEPSGQWLTVALDELEGKGTRTPQSADRPATGATRTARPQLAAAPSPTSSSAVRRADGR